MEKKTPVRLFADFNNADSEGRIRLNTQGTKDDLATHGLTLAEGMNVILDDGDELCADAIVRFCSREGWVAEVDWPVIESRN